MCENLRQYTERGQLHVVSTITSWYRISELSTCNVLIIYSLVRQTKLEESFSEVGRGMITVHCMCTSIKGFIFTEQNWRGFLSLQGCNGLILPLLFGCW